MKVALSCIVEGHGDAAALPVLLRRMTERMIPGAVLDLGCVLRIPRTRLIKPGELERAVELAARKSAGRGGVFVLIDSDDDCPAQVGPQLLLRAQAARGNIPIGVVLARREFESWFLSAGESLRGERGLKKDLEAPDDPESVRGAKEWLNQRMVPGRVYSETLDQPALAALFDLDAARRTDSFDKCWREVGRLTNRTAEENSSGDERGRVSFLSLRWQIQRIWEMIDPRHERGRVSRSTVET